MKHFVFLEIEQERCNQTFLNEMKSVLQEACEVIGGFLDYQILLENHSCDSHVRILISLSFTDWAVKDRYLAHPLHMALLQKIKPVILNKAIFDSPV